MLEDERLVIVLKARQLGLTWLAVGYLLWQLVFRPGTVALLYSRRQDEAEDLLERLRGMHSRLPAWMRADVGRDNQQVLELGRSRVRAFPTTEHSGRSYTANVAVVDEADFIPHLGRVLNAAEPTVEAGGQLVLISTSDKARPESEFKGIWHGGRYVRVFLPWWSRPDRSAGWYAEISARMRAEGRADDLLQEYPATEAEALAPRAAAARFKLEHVEAAFRPAELWEGGPALPGLRLWDAPGAGREYLISCDTSAGDPTSDPCAAIVWDRATWAQVGELRGRFEPAALAGYLAELAAVYNEAVVAVERNNHGATVLLVLEELGARIYFSPLDNRAGWLTSVKGKTISVNAMAAALAAGDLVLRSRELINELAGVQAATLAALEGRTDDLAMAAIVGVAAMTWFSMGEGVSGVLPAVDPIAAAEF